MRLRMPKVTSVTSKDGRATLQYKGITIHPDVGGATYLLEVEWPGSKTGKMTIEAIVVAANSKRISRAAYEAGLDYDNMTLPEQGKFDERFFQEHGRYGSVKNFYGDFIKAMKPSEIEFTREIFINLYFIMNSSYKFNDKDILEEDLINFYPDTIEFNPISLPRKYWKLYHSPSGAGR